MRIDRINEFLLQSKSEYRKFRRTKNEVFLAQAGEKVWVVTQQIIEGIYGRPIHNHDGYRFAINNLRINKLTELYVSAEPLHTYFYEGHMSTFTVESHLKKCYALIDILKRKYSGYLI